MTREELLKRPKTELVKRNDQTYKIRKEVLDEFIAAGWVFIKSDLEEEVAEEVEAEEVAE